MLAIVVVVAVQERQTRESARTRSQHWVGSRHMICRRGADGGMPLSKPPVEGDAIWRQEN